MQTQKFILYFDPLVMKVRMSQAEIASEIRKGIRDQQDFKAFMKNIQSGLMFQQLTETFEQYFKKSQALMLAKQYFQLIILQKFTKVQLLIHYLSSKISIQSVSKISKQIRQGKPKRVIKLLTQQLGEQESLKRFQFVQKQIIEKISQPINGALFLSKQNGFKIYRYPQLMNQQKPNTKNIAIFGETGCGKSTFINAMCNYVLGVQYDDQFRYKVTSNIKGRESFNSQTQEVTDYYIKDEKKNITYRLIDTPGFGDTKGFIADEQAIEQIKLKIKGLNSLHLIIFVLKSSQTRLTVYQKYVLLSVINLFTKQCIPNILFLLTFSDGGKSAAVDILRQGFKHEIKLFEQQNIIKINNSSIFEQINQKIIEYQWLIAFKSIEKIVAKIEQIQPVKIRFSLNFFEKQQEFATMLQQIHQQIELMNICEKCLMQRLDKFVKIQTEIYELQKPMYETKVQYKQLTTKNFVLRCINCPRKNCHLLCTQGNYKSSDPSYCEIIKKKKCSACGCHEIQHKRIKKSVSQSYITIQIQSLKNRKKISGLNQELNKQMRDYEYEFLKYSSGFQELLNKIRRMNRIKLKIEEKGLLNQNEFIEAQINYVELALKSYRPEQKQYKKLNRQISFLHLGHKYNIYQRFKNFQNYLLQSQDKYNKKKTAIAYKIFQTILENIYKFQIKMDQKKQLPLQTSYQTQLIQSQRKRQQKQTSLCCKCIKCLFCCCF